MDKKFCDPRWTADGKPRAEVAPRALETLWFNTGTLCNLSCVNCYIESTPTNDRLVYLSLGDVAQFLNELPQDQKLEIGFTGGEPFMNPSFMAMLEASLSRGHRTLTLTNAMRPMQKRKDGLLELRKKYGRNLCLRVSLDHYSEALHAKERGPKSWSSTMEGLRWLTSNGFSTHVAGRLAWGQTEEAMRAGYANLFRAESISIDARDPQSLVLFPEMDATEDVPEISAECWKIVGRNPQDLMCANSRMVVKHKGETKPSVMACTLIAYDRRFDLGQTLEEAHRDVPLNHPYCSKFCVLGGASCSVKA